MSNPSGRSRLTAAFLALIIASGCSPYRFFYYPNKNLYADPREEGVSYDMVRYPSKNGKSLFAIRLRSERPPDGTIVHFHGNYGNVSNHYQMTSFLVAYGFDVVVFDYQGYGASDGKASPRRLIEDGVATLRWTAENNRSESGKIGVFGHSLGGAVAIAALAREPLTDATVIQSGFTSFRSAARHVLGQSIVGWFLYPFYPWFLSRRYDPIRHVSRLPAVPIAFVHGARDKTIPVEMSVALHAAAPEPKTLWILPEAGHNDLRRLGGEAYERKIADFYRRAFGVTSIASE